MIHVETVAFHTSWLLVIIVHELLHLLLEEIHDANLLASQREAGLE
jgi:hypothetical protein